MPLNESFSTPPAYLAGIREVAERYDGFILDVWGVLHNGIEPFPGVIDCLERLKAAGKRLCVLSNAPRRAVDVVTRTEQVGIPRRLYDEVMSSGEDAWRALERRDDPFYQALGRRCYHIGPDRDNSMRDGLDITVAGTPEEAEFILNTGPWGWDETVEKYEDVLQRARARDLPMICANPDLVVRLGDQNVICAGALAQRYEALGGRVRWHGKPYPSVYATCFDLLGIADRRRVVAVGDSLRTDIAGANRAGIDSILVAGGIHADEFGLGEGQLPDPIRIDQASAKAGARPSAVMAHLAW
jgi:HAD superfamily hydrolase (TIGR01459 family)